ncbi:MAG TPA: glycerol-3-phosphate 1-O-acyltransferase PlsY [Thermoclostridium caenicola]|uniref:Glycerol-3-phosphate acyltransferase n=1 Tax=Thermoclostridium caenicola TaxID=659425 RepID=A0A1M6H3N8_9FIRM|nr:glycerol-3-phosphate 1-O-acyltransferase PlsY [Thermoclostridium caenicola]SHJ16762.1 acyl-phosphate glycerol-3-phosphate acyltransferase [Thermoclostridium caenicola]HOK42777.1 glycerol-3-phosphate 1-O-acyltransferase PlsY [Thermoclostridium caenicola]HOL83670.1 glycerol-3-phosphate 1-O-acyltransferase PlsY [Thermoclostridium caenicola]HOP72707.1 glycerol-3-phosphate 1-O-acyltransferase PlsY [Thermoclostridium caenicola]HPO76517.1 glycerol-3-phosphate 1-O-acyltransferase PlsY [Thermoclostr
MIWILLSAVAGYLLGSINTSLVVGKLFYKKDVRQYGSGNAGATNTLRTLGKTAAAIVVVGDLLKGILACLIGRWLPGETAAGVYGGEYAAGIMAVIGHNWPLYFGFKGGKGVMTAFSVVLMFSPLAALICLLAFIVIVAITRYVSLGSIIGGAAFPLVAWLMGEPLLLVLTGVLLGLLIIIRHASNIRRLLEGNEKKLSFKDKPSGE